MLKSAQIFIISIILLAACSGEDFPPAPAGDHAVLEELADAYRKVSQQYPLSPKSMPPAGRREFVERVFRSAGYDYAATLHALAKQGVSPTSQDQRDLVELVFLPHAGISNEAMGDLYSEQELASIYRIQAAMR